MYNKPTIMKLFITFFLPLAVASIHAQPSNKENTHQLLKRSRYSIDSLFAGVNNNTPGYAIGIIKDTSVLLKKGYGSANLDYNIPNTPTSSFEIASVSKQFTAACIALLILDGKISLEDPASKFISALSKYQDTIRIKHLMYNTSGITDYYKLPRPDGRSWITFNYFDIDYCIKVSLTPDTLAFKPGDKWDYCNTNFMLLAKIVEKVSGQPFSQFAQKRLFEALAMMNTSINDDVTQIVKNRVTPYNRRTKEIVAAYIKEGINIREDGGWIQHPRISPHYGGSGVTTTINDLLLWSKNFFTHQFGGQPFYDLMHKTMHFNNGRDNQAFGLYFGYYKGRQYVAWEGGEIGISTQMIRFPKQKVAIIVLSNLGADGKADQKANEIADILIKDREL